MDNQESFINSDDSVSSFLLNKTSLSRVLDDNSTLVGLQRPFKTILSIYDPISSEIEKFFSLNNFHNEKQLHLNLSVDEPLGNEIFKARGIITQPILDQNNWKLSQGIDALTGSTVSDILVGSNQSLSAATTQSFIAPQTVQLQSALPFVIRTDGTISINNGGDFDGVPTDITDDALIYAAKGFTINGNPILPVQRDAQGNPILDGNGKLILVDRAVAVASGYTTINGSNNLYANLIPPQVVEPQSIIVPAYADIKQEELNRRTSTGASTVIFNSSQNPINNASDWNTKFPSPGTANNPRLVRVTGGAIRFS